MDLFKLVTDEKSLHKNFLNILVPSRKEERNLLSRWAEGFIDRDGKIIKEFQKTFNSTFWELYLWAVIKEYGFSVNWEQSTPDFHITTNEHDFIIEAVTANAAQGKPNEWDKTYSLEELQKIKRFRELNTEAIIRLSNAIFKKAKLYKEKYKHLSHVKGKPFVIAVAPFEQPLFNHQYDRPIKALLYDNYVDEDLYLDSPNKYPYGPPNVKLGFVEKENGSQIDLGLFTDERLSDVSAIIFSCVATWGKLTAMTNNPTRDTTIFSTWATPPTGAPEKRILSPVEHNETVTDGLQIFHNPFATRKLDPNVFRKERVVQFYYDEKLNDWVNESYTNNLQFRMAIATPKEL